MATYSTDLTTLTTAESGTWTEFNAPYNGGGTPASNAEGFIQGTGCYSQTTGKATGLAISCVFDYGSGYSFTAGHAVFIWAFYANGVNLETYANSGWRIGIGSGLGTFDWFRVGGSDYGRNPYGGWTNFAIDPTATETGTIGGGNGGTYRYFGSIPYTLNEITKGEPSAVDAIRAGRGTISITGTGGSFAELASYNDYNAGGTPPGTSSTSVDSGRHRLGLFQAAAGTYLWKGLLSLGTTGSSVTFSDSNETIIIDDCPHTYASFNKVEINNASSSVTWNNITIISTATTANGVGYFEMVANATTNLNGCSFNNMGTFIFQSNGTITSSNFNGCGLITAGSATITDCSINSSTSTTSVLTGAAGIANITGNQFVSDGSNHAIEINSVGTGTINWDNTLSGYVAGTSGTNVTTTSTGNEAIYLNFTSSSTFTINVISGATVPSVRKGAGFTGNVDVIAGAVTLTIKAVDVSGTNVSSARVLCETAAGATKPYQASVSITRSGSTATVTHTAHGLANGDKVVIRGANENEYNGIRTISNVTTNTYDYTVSGTPATPATGSPVSSFVFISALTDGNGEASYTATFAANQPVTGTVRKSSGSPYLKPGGIVGTLNKDTGTTITVVMLSDE